MHQTIFYKTWYSHGDRYGFSVTARGQSMIGNRPLLADLRLPLSQIKRVGRQLLHFAKPYHMA